MALLIAVFASMNVLPLPLVMGASLALQQARCNGNEGSAVQPIDLCPPA